MGHLSKREEGEKQKTGGGGVGEVFARGLGHI